jgi:hypothetical protein
MKTTTAESFEAYKKIYKSKVIVAISETMLSLITFLMSRRLLTINTNILYRSIYWISLVILTIFILICIAFVLLPKGSLI